MELLSSFFVENPQSRFYDSPMFQQVFRYLSQKGQEMQLTLKKTPRSLVMARDGVRTLAGTRKLLEGVRGKSIGEANA